MWALVGGGIMSLAGDGKGSNAGPGSETDAQNEGPWRWGGVFYFAPSDPRTFVPKRGSNSYFPWGSTVNLAWWEGKAFLAGVVGIIIWGIGGTIRDRRLARSIYS